MWSAPRARQPLDATVRLPGSKSLTNRALILAAIVLQTIGYVWIRQVIKIEV